MKKQGRLGFVRGILMMSVLLASAMGGSQVVWAQDPPVITCPPGPIDLTLDDIPTAVIELPITGATSVSGGTWANDTIQVTLTMPVKDTIRVIATNTYGADTCDLIVQFPGVTTKKGTMAGAIWTKAESPYCVVGNLAVASLTIQPGVEVLFYGDFELEVTGILTAVGTASDTILFAGAGTQRWQGMLFEATMPGSQLRYCQIVGAQNSGMRLINTEQVIENTEIRGCSSPTGGGAIYLDRRLSVDTLRLRACRFVGNSSPSTHGGGIWAELGTGSLLMQECIVDSNTARMSGGGIISHSTGGHLIVDDCRFEYNGGNPGNSQVGSVYGGAIYASTASGLIRITRCQIFNNDLYGRVSCTFGCGVNAWGGGAYLSGRTIITNSVFSGNYVYSRVDASTGARNAMSYGGGVCHENGELTIANTVVACNTVYSANGYRAWGAGVYSAGADANIENSTFANNTENALYRTGDSIAAMNSIFFFNNGTNPEISGNVAVTFSDVQGGYPGTGNIDVGPVFLSPSGCAEEDLTILFPSLCIDAGNPDPAYDDVCFGPSLGGARNDLGAHGGPGACGWYGFPWIQNPSSFTSVGCQLPTEVKFPLLIHLQDNVTVSNGATWANDTLYFTPPSEGTHTVRVIAENSYGADTADVAINVTIDIPMNIDQTDMEFTTTDTSTVMPPAQWIHVNSSCGDGMLNWTVEPHFDVEWLEIDKLSGTNPDSVRVALKGDPGSWAPGIYRATLVFRDIAGRHIQTIPLALFVESGVTVGTQYTQPGRTVTVPVYLHTNDTLRDFTIPLRYFTTQSAAVVVDSVSFSHAIVDTAWIIPDQQIIIVDRDIQPPPMPDSTDSMMVPQTCKVADIHFTVRDFAYDEKVLIDTTTYVAPDDDTLRYRFVLATGDTTVPAFSPGQIIIGEEPPCCVMRGDFTHDWPPELTILDLTSLIAYLFRGGAAPQCLDEADVNADGGVTVGDATMLICIIFRDCQTPLACGVVKSARRAAPEPIASLRTEFDGAATTVILEASEPLMGVQITLQADHPDSIANTTETGLELVHGTVDGLTRVGLLDLQGEVHLPQGSTTLFTVPGEVTLVDGLVADMSHQSMIARIGGKSSSPNLPRRFELAQNYPNPFNPTTVIQFALPVATHVRLEVINILGQTVTTLVDRQMEAGYQSVEWNSTNSDGSRVASGVYFYRLEAGTFRDTKKMLLLK